MATIEELGDRAERLMKAKLMYEMDVRRGSPNAPIWDATDRQTRNIWLGYADQISLDEFLDAYEVRAWMELLESKLALKP